MRSPRVTDRRGSEYAVGVDDGSTGQEGRLGEQEVGRADESALQRSLTHTTPVDDPPDTP